MRRIERRLFRLTDEISRLDREIMLVEEELSFHRHIADDARRDAVVGNADDRAFAAETAGDVPRFERSLASLRARRRRLESKRVRLLGQM